MSESEPRVTRKLFLDEDSQDKKLVAALESDFEVTTAHAAGLTQTDDHIILSHATTNGMAVVTHNCEDFVALHEANPNHGGIVVVYRSETDALPAVRIARCIRNANEAGEVGPTILTVANRWDY